MRPDIHVDRAPAVRLDRVCKRYGRGAAAVEALKDMSLTVAEGEFVSIMGASGCGKSTMLNLVAGLDQPDSGRVLVGGDDLAQLDDNTRSAMRLRRIGFVFQSFNLFPTFTVRENVAWPLEFLGVRWREARARADTVLGQLDVNPARFDRRPAELSGGEQQRIAIARALVTAPRVLLADEPTGNLDSRTGQTILDVLRALNAEHRLTVVMVTHSAFAATYGHRTVELQDGHIIRQVSAPGTPARVVPLRS